MSDAPATAGSENWIKKAEDQEISTLVRAILLLFVFFRFLTLFFFTESTVPQVNELSIEKEKDKSEAAPAEAVKEETAKPEETPPPAEPVPASVEPPATTIAAAVSSAGTPSEPAASENGETASSTEDAEAFK